jgi:hypothetical protein
VAEKGAEPVLQAERVDVDVAKTVEVYERVEVVDSEVTGEWVGDVVIVFVMRIDGEPVEDALDVLELLGDADSVPDFREV